MKLNEIDPKIQFVIYDLCNVGIKLSLNLWK